MDGGMKLGAFAFDENLGIGNIVAIDVLGDFPIAIKFESITRVFTKEEAKHKIIDFLEKYETQSSRWRPNIGDRYWQICLDSDTGEIYTIWDMWDNTPQDKGLYLGGNCFQNESHAEMYLDEFKRLLKDRPFDNKEVKE